MATIRLVGPTQREYAASKIQEAPDGYVVKIAKETRRDRQNRMMWPMLKDIQDQVEGFGTFSQDDIKLRFLHALGQELRFLPALEGEGMFPVGQRSSTLTVLQFAGLIELMFQFGAKHSVSWSRKSQDVVEEVMTQ